jgi:hypothetical protein
MMAVLIAMVALVLAMAGVEVFMRVAEWISNKF